MCEKYALVASRAAVKIGSLEKLYHLTGAERLQTKYGISTHPQGVF
jgi:hypothetical protein